jgi:predicted transcriptional regulator
MEQQRTDILISIKPIHIGNIVSRLKTHEFRKYLVPNSVRRMWFYTSVPTQSLQYIAVVSNGKTPDDISDSDGSLGMSDFKSGLKESLYGYEILELYEVEEPYSLQDMKERGWIKGPPQKYQWVPKEMLDNIPLEGLKKVF